MSSARFLLPLLLAVWLAPAGAQVDASGRTPEQAAAHRKHEAQAIQWFNMLDANGDGCVSEEEGKAVFFVKPSLRQWFKDTDTDGDGCLTQDEVRAEAGRRRAARLERRRREAAERAAQEKQPGAPAPGSQ